MIDRFLPPLGFALVLAFVPWFRAAATIPRWALLSASVPMLLCLVKLRPGKAHWLLAAGLAYAAASIFWMDVPLDGVNGLWMLVILAGVFCLGAESGSILPTMKAMAMALSLMVPIAVAQVYGWSGVSQIEVPGALFLNTDIFGESCAALAVAMMVIRCWWLVPGLLLGLALSKDRTGMVALFVSCAAYAALHYKQFTLRKMAILVFLLATVSGAIVGTSFVKRSTIDADAKQGRIAIWRDTIDGMTWKGNGIGSFYSEYQRDATRLNTLVERPDQAHSEPLQYAFELGAGSVFLFAAMLYALGGRLELERIVLIAVLVEGLFAFPFHMPVTGFVGALVAGRLSGARYHARRVVGDSGERDDAYSANDAGGILSGSGNRGSSASGGYFSVRPQPEKADVAGNVQAVRVCKTADRAAA